MAQSAAGMTRLERYRRLFVREVVHIGSALLKSLAAIFIFVWLIGIPGSWVISRIQHQSDPYELRIKRITWNPLRGFIGHGPRFFAGSGRDQELIAGDALIIRPDYKKLRERKFELREVAIEGGRLIVPFTPENYVEHHQLALHDIDLHGAIIDDEIQVNGYIVSGPGMNIHTRGRIRISPADPTKPPDTINERIAMLLEKIHALQSSPDWCRTALGYWNGLESSSRSNARLDFETDTANPVNSHASFSWYPREIKHRDHTIHQGELQLVFTNQSLLIDKIELGTGDHNILVKGRYELTNSMIQAHIYGDLPPQLIETFMPPAVHERIATLGLKWEGTLHAEGWIGPCQIADVPTSWSSWITLEDGRLNDFPVERFFVSVKRSPDALVLQDGVLEGGTEPGRGIIKFAARHDYAKELAEGSIDIGIDLGQLRDVLPKGLRQVADMFTITDTPVKFTTTYTAPLSAGGEIVVRGNAVGTNFSFRSVFLNGADISFVYSNDVVTLDPFTIYCPTGGVDGSLVLNLDNDHYGIDLEVQTNPQYIAPMVGQKFAAHFAPYHFSDDIVIRVKGYVDADRDETTDLHIHASGKRIGFRRLTSDHLLVQAHRTPGLLEVTNFVAAVAQGTAQGELTIKHLPDTDLYALKFAATNLAFDDIGAMINPAKTNRYEGTISGSFDLTGPFPDEPGWTQMTGTGQATIENGRLLLIPVFGGLSTILGKIYPGLGFSEQSRAESKLEFKDGMMLMNDMKITGNLVSLAAKGSYAWTDELKCDVLLHPFRDGSIASAVRVVTMPISMLLEFKVTGSITNPVWKAANIPLL